MTYPVVADVLHSPAPAGPALVAATIVLAATLVAQKVLCRSAASRHAVVLAGLLAVGVSPLVFLATNLVGVAPVVHLPMPNMLTHATNTLQTPESSIVASRDAEESPSIVVSWADGLWRLWMLGSLVELARIGHGLIVIRRLRRTAASFDGAKARRALDRLPELLGRSAPLVFVSTEVTAPMTVGFIRPAVLLPLQLAEQIGELQLLQVLLHEGAHAVRRDPLVGLYQRALAALLWFHPLVHLSNRLLDDSREELCDNYALRAASGPDYARTLLWVARSIGPPPHTRLVTPLFRSVQRLERRVAGLLVPGRNAMTCNRVWKSVTIATVLLTGGYALTAWAAGAAKSDGHNLTHRVAFTVGAQQFRDGDAITITEVIGTADRFEAGNIYIIKGTYRLSSEKNSALTAYVTVDGDKVQELRVPTQKTQTMEVEQGEGRFSLIYYMWQDGWPHLSFYPNDGGSWIGTVYFGTDDTVLKRGWWEK